MKTKCSKQKAFTIIELLTVMSIIVILIGLLVPALNSVRRYATKVKQKAQFNAITDGLEMFRNDFEEYPDSRGLGTDQVPYCGAMKLAEAMVGQDLLGFHPQSTFRADSINAGTLTDGQYYRLTSEPDYSNSLAERKDPYLPVDKVPAFQLSSIYPQTGVFSSGLGQPGQMFVLADVFKRAQNQGGSGPSKVGMPVLYYKASESGQSHDPAVVDTGNYSASGNIYNYCDNTDILDLQLPWAQGSSNYQDMHPISKDYLDPGGQSGIALFYALTEDIRIRAATTGSATGSGSFSRPYRPESFILISAGFDGRYGTSDDVTNFEQQ